MIISVLLGDLFSVLNIAYMSTARSAKKASRTDWHKADVIAALHKRGTSLRQLALAYGYNGRALTKVLYRPWYRAEVIVAAALGLSPEKVWPSRYDKSVPQGSTRPPRAHDNNAGIKRNAHPAAAPQRARRGRTSRSSG